MAFFLFVNSLLRNKNKLLLKIPIKIFELLLLSAGVKVIPYSFDVFSSLVEFSSSIIRCIWSSNPCITVFLIVVVLIMAVFLSRREADYETEHRDGGFLETTFHHAHENDVQLSPPFPPPPEMSHVKETSDNKPAGPTEHRDGGLFETTFHHAHENDVQLSPPFPPPPEMSHVKETSDNKPAAPTEHRDGGLFETTFHHAHENDVQLSPPSPPPPEMSHVKETSDKKPAAPTMNLASRISSGNLYQSGIIISDVLDNDYSRIRPNGAERIITSDKSSSIEAQVSREIEKTPSYSPPKVTSRISSSTLYPAVMSSDNDVDHDSAISSRPTGVVESVVTLPAVRRFSGEARHMSEACCEIEKKPYTPTGVEPRNKSTLYPSFSDIHGSSNATELNGTEQMIITSEKSAPVRRFSSEARVSAREIEKKPLLASRSSTYLSQGSSSGCEIHDDSADTTIKPNSRNQIITTREKTVVSSPVSGFSSGMSKAREIKKKPYSHGSSMDPMEPTKLKKVTRNPPAKVGEETIITNPPSKKGKDIITESLPDDAMENDESDSLDAAWDAIKRGENKKAKKKKLKKSETWEIPQQRRREVQRLDSEEVLPSSPLWKELRKSVTFDDVISAKLRGGLMRRDDSWNPDEFKKKMDGFIKATKDEIRDGIEESKRRKFLNLFRRGQ